MRIVTIDSDQAGPPPNEDWFPAGGVRMQRLTQASEQHETELISVWFPAGSRTKPHTHEVDQVLHIVSGEGIVASESMRRIIRAGDVVVIPAGIWHWHGATPDSDMHHISIKGPGSTDWTSAIGDWETYMEGAE